MFRSDQALDLAPAADAEDRPRRAVGRWLVLANALVAAVVLLLAWGMLDASRDSAERRARVATENLASGLQQAIAAEINEADKALRSVAAAYRHGGPGAVDNTLAEQLAAMPELRMLIVADGLGVVHHRAGAAAPADVAESDFFRAAREGGDALVVSGPERSAGTGPGWIVALARRLEQRDGSFAGVAAAALPIEHFAQVLGSVDLGSEGAASLRSADLRLIARHSPGGGVSSAIGSNKVSDELRRAVQANAEQGGFVARTAIDRVERSNAYRRVGHYPLLVLVGIGTDDYLAPWRAEVARVGALAGLLLLIVGAASLLLYRAWRRESESARALLAAGRRNRALLLTASDGIHVLDREGFLVGLNEAFAAMLGERREALVGRHASSWDSRFPEAQIRATIGSQRIGERQRFETRHRRADGREIEVEVQSVGVRIDSRELVYCSARDITRRKQLEAELAAAAAATQDLYDNAPCGYHSLDENGVFVRINDTELGWLGCTRDEVVGKKRISDFFTAEGRAVFEREFPRLLAEGRIEGLEFDLPGRDGSQRRVSVSATVVRDDQGRFLHSRSVLYDITELTRTREALQRLAHEQQAMLDNDLVGIVRTRNGIVIWANRAMEMLFGYRHDELLGRAVRSFYPDDASYEAFQNARRLAFESEGRHRAQVENLRKDGSRIWIDANGLPMSADSSEMLWLLADITAIKQSQSRAEHLAFHDGLTGLPNRLLLSDRLQQALAAAERSQRRVAVCYLDLDGFKAVNDRFGHDAGDRLLCEVAVRLQRCVRANDTVARIGGDEFVLLLTELDDGDGHLAVVERVRSEVAKPVTLARGEQVQVSASIGIAIFPDDGRQPEALIARADEAMYAVKHGVAASSATA